jgi:MATE family multidrug resistance protein
MGTVDSIMAGHLSATALAAVALGNIYFFAVAIFGQGVLMALDPLVAQAVGAGDEPAIARALQRGLVLAAALSVPIGLLLLPASAVLRAIGQPAEVVPGAGVYDLIMIPSVLPFLAFVVMRQTLQALHRMRPIVYIILLANLTNVGLNWVLIYGNLGAPALGVAGSAWATTVSRWLMAVGLVALAWRDLGHRLVPVVPELFAWAPLRRMLHLGIPIGLQYQAEYAVFGTVAMLMGRFGTVPVAAHQVAINLASLTFMVPLGISAAATVLVGHAVGRGDMPAARRAALAALVCGTLVMATTALIMLALPRPLAALYTADSAVIALAAVLLPVAGAFQIFDGLQVVSIGILRGAADTRAPFLIGVLGFWLLGFPVSLWLGFRTPLGAAGLWWGFVVGLAAVAVLLLARVRARLRRHVDRVVVEAAPVAESDRVSSAM